MRVGIVMPLADLRGGAELMMLHLLRANKQLTNIEYTLVFFENGPLVKEAEKLGYSVNIYHTGKLRQFGRYVSTVFSLFQWMKRENIDIVMSWMSKAHLYAGPAAWLARIDAIWFQHGTPDMDFLEKCLKYIPAKAVLCPSQAAKESQSRNNPKLRTIVIYPAVDLREYDPSALPPSKEVRKTLGLPVKSRIVGIVARLQRWKGIHIFVEAAALVAKDHPDIHFVIVGGNHRSEPDYPDELASQALSLGIANKIYFAGHQANVSSWIHSVDILVHCTVGIEPFGMVIIEGMALGKAVIAAKAGGPLEIVTHSENGLLVPPNDAAELSMAILKLIEEPEYYTELCSAGLNRAKAFSTERLSNDMAEFLESLRIGA
ncbi:glycosyltransferase [Cohnella luojiensis]|uniref:Glycosyltransferase family 1 protein n=1 Tax=Cohnella luojiensis TaxID=652876 RepID=A0A4Y8LPY4_9BACL|nr:glycosyltransferase [Cohnella luojiensis]TFE22639.1 glycosyltransferase family 1 protein [Cohnella luojiensis]